MDKTLQDLAWSLLPKEFKEGVKKEWECINNAERLPHDAFLGGQYQMIRDLFGTHNLTSDAEGKEMLTAHRQQVQNLYNYHKSRGHHLAGELRIKLFSSKCLPDLREQKPTQPKFKVGDKVECLHNHHIYVIRHLDFYDGIWRYNYGNPAIWIKESDLEPYTEPEKESRNLSKNIANCDKQFDNILKDSFRNERRLNVAVQMVKAITQCPEIVERIASAEADSLLDDILSDALYLTDRLIAKCEEGGNHEKA